MAHRQPDSDPNVPVQWGDVPARLIALLEHDPTLALSVLALLEEAGIANSEFVRAHRKRLRLARGDRGALIEHGASGAELTTRQAADLLAEALAGAHVPEAAIVNAANLLGPLSQPAKGQLVAAIRASQDRGRSASALESLCVAARATSADARHAIIELGIELINKIASSAGEQPKRKTWTLRAINSCAVLQPLAIGRLLEAALSREVIYTYDIVHHKAISQLAVTDEHALRQLVNRSESSADVTAASSLVGQIQDEWLRGQYLRLLLKQFGDQRAPTREAASNILPGLNALVQLHEAAPEKLAASHDEALLRRWAAQYVNLKGLEQAANRIGLARSVHRPATQATAREAQRLAAAISYIKDVIIPADLRIVAVGGEKTQAAADAFNEFGRTPPQWGEWIIKERQAPLSAYQIPEQISSSKCVGVLIITNPASHAMTNQAKDAAESAGKPVVWIEYATKKKIREGMKLLVEKILAKRSGQSGFSL
jgi:hypothetical protein